MNWKSFQSQTAELFIKAGCSAEVEKIVEGVRGKHEIDVYVTFKRYGIECVWVIECKCWNSNVPKEKVAALQSIVSDVGADRGVIISKKGFQSGAIRLSLNSNVTLASLDDLKDYLREEIESKEIDFIELQLLQTKHELFNIKIKEKTKYGYTSRFPSEISSTDGYNQIGNISFLLTSIENMKMGSRKFYIGFDEETNKIITTDSIQLFIEAAKECIFKTKSLLSKCKSKNA
ncbi:restriction endonuclease [Teredinibacter turnerae]|uniref:restriction endonuclease n=1 Tax=Teredinibacter turnerae TaxID=2426 RepID=UPI00038087EB|nr:restriction endonuclease [Teredinibacter turnerae]